MVGLYVGERTKATVTAALTNNNISPDNPCTIIFSVVGISGGAARVAIVKTDSVKRPARIDKRCTTILKQWKRLYVGVMLTSQLKHELPNILMQRDLYNLIHRIGLKKQPLTPEIIQSITDPKMKRELIEAACLAAI